MKKMLVALTRAALATMIAATLIGASTSPTSASVVDFKVYDRTTYTNVNLVAAGAIRATNVTNTSWASLLASGGLPTESAFKSLITSQVGTRMGPVVLDFESIYLRGVTRAVAETRRTQWITLLTWTREAVPGRMIGIYNFLHELDTANIDLAKEVSVYEDAFFPAMYTYLNNTNNCSDQSGWLARLNAMIARGDQIDPLQKTIPFVWPQIYPTCPGGGGFVPAAQWRWQLDTIRNSETSGLLIYSGGSAGTAELGWYNETVSFLNTL